MSENERAIATVVVEIESAGRAGVHADQANDDVIAIYDAIVASAAAIVVELRKLRAAVTPKRPRKGAPDASQG